ncbi:MULTISPECIES: GNAT family N-acetyltransferase [Streptomyces]
MSRAPVPRAHPTPEAPVTVRPRLDPDLPACVEALRQVHLTDGYPTNWPARPADWLAGGGLLGAWVAALGGRVAGHVALCRSTPDDVAPGVWSGRTGTDVDEIAVVSRLFVAPEARGRGIGALLLARVVAEAGELGLFPVLDVVASDTSATALYERTGWRFLGTGLQHWSPEQTVTVRCYAAPDPTPS